jgi:hypothetical protein
MEIDRNEADEESRPLGGPTDRHRGIDEGSRSLRADGPERHAAAAAFKSLRLVAVRIQREPASLPPQLSSARTHGRYRDSLALDSLALDSLALDSPLLDSPLLDSPLLDPLLLDSLLLDSPPLDSLLLDSPPLDSLLLDSPPLDSLLLDSPPLDSPPLDSPPLDSPHDVSVRPAFARASPVMASAPGSILAADAPCPRSADFPRASRLQSGNG